MKLTRKEKKELKIKERADLLFIVLNNKEIEEYLEGIVLDYFECYFEDGEELSHLCEENSDLTFEDLVEYCTLYFDGIEVDCFVYEYIDTICDNFITISTEEAIETLLYVITNTDEMKTKLKRLYDEFLDS